MTRWAQAPEMREQLVLFPRRLDDAVAGDHRVRLLDEILRRIDWSSWEAEYHERLGQPAIHPRVMVSVWLYALIVGVGSSRGLEEALNVRLDFRWLAEGLSIDHTTLSEFRRRHGPQLKHLFVQVGLVARELGLVTLAQVAFDGTRIRANNRRSRTRSQADLRRMQAELAAQFREFEIRIERGDAAADAPGASQLPAELADWKRRQQQVDAALAELARMQESDVPLPQRIPLTDPQSRVLPNKEGGYAPNYTPLATVDVDSGLIVAADVVSTCREDQHLLAALDQVQADFQLDAPVPEVLADGLIGQGANLAALAERGVTLYAPVKRADPQNPALRADPSQPVPPEQWDQLPVHSTTIDGRKFQQVDKSAFVYDARQDCYWCPQGQKLALGQTTRERRGQQQVTRFRYHADPQACASCPLRARCVRPSAARRQVDRDQYEPLREALVQRMSTPEGAQKYARRRHAGERPFAMIKHHFGTRRFLLRGLERVRTEWTWLATAFNIHRLTTLLRAGPPASPLSSATP